MARGAAEQMLTFPTWRKHSSTPTTDYSYKALNTQRHEIRLLRIERSLRLKTPIVCSLRVISLDDASIPPYCALSYCWGNSPADRPIECDGSVIRITGDLLDALRSLRKLTRAYLWVDQICINQTDVEERSAQVQLIRRIYPGASKTYLHLGHRSDFSKWLVFCLRHFWRLTVIYYLPSLHMLDVFGDSLAWLATMQWLLKFLLSKRIGRSCSPLRVFFDRPCFARAWILQEAALSPNIELVCRNTAIRWDHFGIIVHPYLVQLREQMVLTPQPLHGSWVYFRSILGTIEEGENTLLNLVIQSNHMKASEPRDRVYALLGLALDAGRFPPPNYNISVTDVYQRFAAAVVANGRGPNLLSLGSSCAQSHQYPSWVPDLERIFSGLRLEDYSLFSAGRSGGNFNVLPGSSVLSTEGLVVDIIFRTFPFNTDRIHTDGEVFESLLELVTMTADAMAGDFELSSNPFSWSSMADLQLMLILYLCFDHERLTSREEGLLQDYQDYNFVANQLLLQPNPWIGGIPDETESDTLADVLSAHLRKFYNAQWVYAYFYLRLHAAHGRFAITHAGRLCLVPFNVEAGDQIGVILGARAPYVLREDGDGFLKIGESYIRGLMHGEALDDGRYTVQQIRIH